MSIADDMLAEANAAPKRRTLDERIAHNDARGDQLKRQRAARDRRADDHRKFIIGVAVMNAMAAHPDLHDRMAALLSEWVVKPRDREAVAPWLRSREG